MRLCNHDHTSGVAADNDSSIGRSYFRFIKHAGLNAGDTPAEGGFEMFARKIQLRAALLAVSALAVIAASSTAASAATRPGCPENPYTVAGRDCIEHQASQVTVVQKVHHVAKKHSSSRCRSANPYARYIYCR